LKARFCKKVNITLVGIESTLLQKCKYHTFRKVDVTQFEKETNMMEMKHTSYMYQEYESTISQRNPNNLILGIHLPEKKHTGYMYEEYDSIVSKSNPNYVN
jgi:hypothetical protein